MGGDDTRKGALTTGTDGGTVAKTAGKLPPQAEQPPRVTGDSDQCVKMNVAWVFQPETFDDVKKKSKNIVEAEVVSIAEGEPLGTPTADEPGDTELIPTQKITLRVTKAHKGGKSAGQTIELFRTGSDCFVVEHDPAYKKGEQYLLMLDDGPKGMMKTVSPEGRYRKTADGSLEAVVPFAKAAKQLNGKKLADVQQELSS
jgi:hypothetical protein